MHRDNRESRKVLLGGFENMEWDKDGLKEEVNSFGDGTLVNWSELARRYGVKNKTGQLAQNAGQIVMEWLKSEGVDVGRLKNLRILGSPTPSLTPIPN